MDWNGMEEDKSFNRGPEFQHTTKVATDYKSFDRLRRFQLRRARVSTDYTGFNRLQRFQQRTTATTENKSFNRLQNVKRRTGHDKRRDEYRNSESSPKTFRN